MELLLRSPNVILERHFQASNALNFKPTFDGPHLLFRTVVLFASDQMRLEPQILRCSLDYTTKWWNSSKIEKYSSGPYR